MAILELPSALVSVDWLAEHIDAPNLVVLDASVAKPVSGNIAEQNVAGWIPRTQLFDFDKTICDMTSALPHMLPDAADFTAEVQKLGVNKDSLIVIYDRQGVYSSPRGWWMFRAMGYAQVAVLNGGFPAWHAAGYPVLDIKPQPVVSGNFSASYQSASVWDSVQVLAALGTKETDVIDARSEGRFYGKAPEPREGLRSGHMPHAINLPFDRLIKDGRMRSISELQKIFVEKQLSTEKQLVFSCGSGLTACILALGAELVGYTHISVYDGSWSEWGLPSELPVTTEAT